MEVANPVAANRFALGRLLTGNTVRAAILGVIAMHAAVFHSPIAVCAFEVAGEVISRPNTDGVGIGRCGTWIAAVSATLGGAVALANGFRRGPLTMVTNLAFHPTNIIVAYRRAMIGRLGTGQAILTTAVRRVVGQADISDPMIVGQAGETTPLVIAGGHGMIRFRTGLAKRSTRIHAGIGQA